MDCPSEEQFYDWLLDGDGVLPSDVRDHVAACPKCSGTVEAFTFLAKSLSGLRQKVVEEDSPLPPLPAAASVSDEPKRIGNYLILERLGEGGMGVVYKAFDLPCARMVALKLVRPAHCTDPAYQKRFLAECRVAAQLSHPHIVRVLDQDSVDGRLFCAMEYVKGTSLDRALAKEGLLPAATATRIALQIAAGLGEAHRQRVVHRDVKPANVLLEDNLERVRITDFGVMKDLNRDTSVTEPGLLVGTLNFMAPEQIDGKPVTPATDVFAVGVILYQMLTGKLPFNDTTPTAVMRKIVDEAHRGLHEFGDLVPPPLREIVDKCLAKDPARRYQSGGELAEALARYLGQTPAMERGASRAGGFRERRLWKACLLTAAVAALIGSGLYLRCGRTASGLVASWQFDEGSGLVATDSSGHGNSGRLINGPQWTAGFRGGALSFDGLNETVTVPDSPSLDGMKALTLQAWVWVRTYPPARGSARLIGKWALSTDDRSYDFRLRWDGTLEPSIKAGGQYLCFASSRSVALNRWTHVCATWDGATLKVWLDGVADASAGLRAGSIGDSAEPLRMGGKDGGDCLQGRLDDIRIYRYARTPKQIAADAAVAPAP